MSQIVVSKLEQYPVEEPTGWAVGFSITTANNRNFYLDTFISFTDADTDEDAVSKASIILANNINQKITELESKSPIIGQEIVLPEVPEAPNSTDIISG